MSNKDLDIYKSVMDSLTKQKEINELLIKSFPRRSKKCAEKKSSKK